MGFQHYDGGVVADQATGRPLMGQPVKIFDEETDAPIQAYREGQPVTLVTGAHGLIPQFQTEDSTRRVRMEVGPVRLRQWSQEMIASAAAAGDDISSALERVEVVRAEAAAIVPRMEQIEAMAGLAPGEVTDAQTANLVSREGTATRDALNAAIILRDREVRLNVRDYGARGNGIDDDTAAINAALGDAGPGTTIWVPPGDYLAQKVNPSGISGLTFAGVRGASILRYNQAGAGATDNMIQWHISSRPTENDRNITFRDLTMRGAGALSEHQALVFLSATDDVLVDNCEFLDMQGDGINIARTAVGGVDTGVHNARVRVRNTLFDGIDRRGRQGISILDGDDISVSGCTFRRLAASTMPGAIDIEPNKFDTSAVTRNINIYNNVFEDNGGFAGDVGLSFVPTTGEARFENINVFGNQFSGTRARHAVKMEWYQRAALATDPLQHINVFGNTINAPAATMNAPNPAAVQFDGIRGFSVENNEINGWSGRAIAGGLAAHALNRNGSIKRNRITDSGATTGYVVNFDYFHDLEVSDNTATSPTTLAAFMAVMAGYNVSGLKVTGNRLAGFSDALFTSAAANSAQTNPGTNQSYGNVGVPRQVATAAFATGKLVPAAITGSRGGNAAMASLLAELAKAGIITDSTTA